MKFKNIIFLLLSATVLIASCGTSQTSTEETTIQSCDSISNTVDDELLSLINDDSNDILIETEYILVKNEGKNLDISIAIVYHGQDTILKEFSEVRNIVKKYINEADYNISRFMINSAPSSEGIISWSSSDLETGLYLNSITDECYSSFALKNYDDLESAKVVDVSESNTETVLELSSDDTLVKSNSSIDMDTDSNKITNDSSESALTSVEKPDVIAENSDISAEESDTQCCNFNNGENNFDTYNNEEQQNTEQQYVLNTDTNKIHLPSCRMVPKIAPENYSTTNLDIESLESQGYTTCGICFK